MSFPASSYGSRTSACRLQLLPRLSKYPQCFQRAFFISTAHEKGSDHLGSCKRLDRLEAASRYYDGLQIPRWFGIAPKVDHVKELSALARVAFAAPSLAEDPTSARLPMVCKCSYMFDMFCQRVRTIYIGFWVDLNGSPWLAIACHGFKWLRIFKNSLGFQ